MTTSRQLRANRSNAKKSTGPRSAGGKCRSSRNATRHGLRAEQVLLRGEDRAEFEQLREAVFEELAPANALEEELIDRLVSLTWRLRRVPRFEAGLYEMIVQTFDVDIDGTEEEEREQDGADVSDSEADEEQEKRFALGQVFETMLEKDFTGKLSRYETGLQNQFAATFAQFQKLVAARRARTEVVANQLANGTEARNRVQRLARET